MTVPTRSELAVKIAELVDAAVSAAAPAPTAAPHEDTYLLRAEKAAERLGVSRSQVYAMIKSGELEGVRVGRWINVPVSSVRAYIDSHRISA
ncbi:MAG: helix-turn-helix domain-containing protein [Mycobacterium sp.]|nr:helix-turn-helix domain-containing protein [Mycobacterium sp.]